MNNSPIILTYDLVDPDADEVRKQLTCSKTTVMSRGSEFSKHRSRTTWCERFKKFSSWTSLVRAIACLKGFLRRIRSERPSVVALWEDAELFIIKQAQNDRFLSRDSYNRGREAPTSKQLFDIPQPSVGPKWHPTGGRPSQAYEGSRSTYSTNYSPQGSPPCYIVSTSLPCRSSPSG
jgi:hypothetical protein